MADFRKAYEPYILPNEGGYTNNVYAPNDKGGETYAGIARNYNPTWRGWSAIDLKKSRYKNGLIPWNEKFPDVQFMVDEFYQDRWDKNLFGQINSQPVADLLFDYHVNSQSYAIKAIQRIVGVKDDGVMGPLTIAAINAADPNKLHAALKKQRGEFYEYLIAKDPTQEDFRKTWFARLARFPDLISSPGGIATILVFVGIGVGLFFLARPQTT